MEYPDRKSIRNPKHDYSRSSSYFITTNTRGAACLFGKVNSEGIILNELGITVQSCWKEIPNHFPSVEIDQFVVMPNHFHGIIHIHSTDRACPVPAHHPHSNPYSPNHFGAQPKGSLGIIIGQFKAAVTRWAKENGQGGIFDWLPRYNDRIIRDKEELIAFRNYISNNPKKWVEKYGHSD